MNYIFYLGMSNLIILYAIITQLLQKNKDTYTITNLITYYDSRYK